MSGDPMINGVVSQGFFGVGMSYGFVNSASADLYYQHSLHQIHLGGSMQFPDTRGNLQSDPSGRGSTIESSGSYYWSVDAGVHTLRMIYLGVRVPLIGNL